MKIGELSSRTGVAASAIRFYERCGLMPLPRREANGYRRYDDDAVDRLRIVSLSFGLTIEQLRTAFDAHGGLVKPQMLSLLCARLAGMDELIDRLQTQRTELRGVLQTLTTHWSRGACVDPATFASPTRRGRATGIPPAVKDGASRA